MAQLTDDCFAFDGPLMPLEAMEALIKNRVVPVTGSEIVALADARGRVLAKDVIAPIDIPHFDNSAVDGYAVRHADLNASGETVLKVSAKVMAGQSAIPDVGAKEAIRIFTGARMPDGADTVFMQEDTREDSGSVVLPSGLKRGANRRLKGEDIVAGSIAMPQGRVLDAQNLALAAALGLTKLEVRRRIRVSIFSTGDEIVEPGTSLSGAQVFDANRMLLRHMLEQCGCDVSDLGILRDDLPTLERAISDAASSSDVVLTSGGVSTGDADYVKNAVEAIGSLVFWRIAIKPGRPVAMGVIPHSNGNRAAFVGLPGNPVAVFVTFVRVVKPLLAQLAGAVIKPQQPLMVVSAFDYRKKSGRREYVRVALRPRADGGFEAIKHPQDGAGVLTSLTETDGLLELPDNVTSVKAGERVSFFSYAALSA
jgi:molybdopterin molybdotransferase